MLTSLDAYGIVAEECLESFEHAFCTDARGLNKSRDRIMQDQQDLRCWFCGLQVLGNGDKQV